MSQQDGTSLFFYSAGLLVHDYESGREAPGTCESLGAHSQQRQQCVCAPACVCLPSLSLSAGVMKCLLTCRFQINVQR